MSIRDIAQAAGVSHGPVQHHFGTREELAGAEPERLLDPAVPTPAMLLAASIRDLQARTAPAPGGLDPDLVSAYVNASLFAFATMAPWLMTAVGLEPRDYEARLDEIIDISVRLIALSVGAPTES